MRIESELSIILILKVIITLTKSNKFYRSNKFLKDKRAIIEQISKYKDVKDPKARPSVRHPTPPN